MLPPKFRIDFRELPAWREDIGWLLAAVFWVLSALVKVPTYALLRLARQDAMITPHGFTVALSRTSEFIVTPCVVWQAMVNVTGAACFRLLGARVERLN